MTKNGSRRGRQEEGQSKVSKKKLKIKSFLSSNSNVNKAHSSSTFTSNIGGGSGTSSLSTLLFGAEPSACSVDNDLFSSEQARKLQQISNDRLKFNQKNLHVVSTSSSSSTQCVGNDNQNVNTKEMRKDILESRTRRVSLQPTIDAIESITLVLPVLSNDDNDEIEKMEGCKSAKANTNTHHSDEIIQTGIMKLFTKKADSIMRESGVLIIKQHNNVDNDHHTSSSITNSTNMLFPSTLLDSMIKQSKQIEYDICQQLTKKGNIWQRNNHNSDNDHNQKKLEENVAFQYDEVASRCFGRLDIRYGMDQPPFSNDEVIANKVILPIIHSLLGKSARLVYTGLILSFPNSANQPWHQDGTALFDEDDGFTSNMHLPPYALNVFVPLDDVDEKIGPTEFILGSHYGNVAKKIIQEPPNNQDVSAIGPLLNIGDVLIYDYRVCHRGTSNLSLEKTRPMIYLMYARPWFYEHLNFGKEKLFGGK